MRILVVEDEADLAAAVAEALQAEAYAVDVAADGAAADELMSINDYDLAILDWSIPPPTGLELLAAWRQRGVDTPVLMLTGRGGLDDRVSGLDSGADDYLTKPFAYRELLARVRTLLRRRDKAIPPLAAGDVEMDRAGRRVRVGGEPVRLTAKEFAVLEHLMRHAGEVVSRASLAEHAWDHTFDPASNTLDVIVSRVRRKIDGERPERLLETVSGVGYRLARERR
jgi:DNA-binding response OmpR family regulator